MFYINNTSVNFYRSIVTHTFECKKDNFPSVRRKYKKERPKPLFM